MEGKFIGPEKIISIEEAGETPKGAKIYRVHTEVVIQGSSEPAVQAVRTYTEPVLEAVVTEESSDWNTFRDSKFKHIINDMTAMAIEYGISGEEMDPLLMAVGRNFATMIDKAVYKKWFGNTDDFVPGGTSFHGFTLLDAHNTLHGGTDPDTTGEGSDTADKA